MVVREDEMFQWLNDRGLHGDDAIRWLIREVLRLEDAYAALRKEREG